MKTGIVLEGGAFRTVFSCGVTDAFMQFGILPDYMIGVSAGAAYGISYASSQPGRSYDIIMNYANDKRYMGMKNFFAPDNRSYYGLKFAYDTIPNELVPFDYEAYRQYNGTFEAVVTNVITGRGEYMRVSPDDKEFKILRATCALPGLFPLIFINGTPYLDGGIADSIPIERAFSQGCDRVVVVLTRQPGYRKDTSLLTKTMALMYGNRYPMLAKSLLTRAEKYNRCLDRLEQYEKEGRIIIIRPKYTDNFSRTERDLVKIDTLYRDGLSQGVEIAEKVKNFYGMN
ncbi:MAG: patatin family protein [Lachnospiraceae bacterium]